MSEISLPTLFLLFFKSGGLTLGDGYAVLAPLRKAIVDEQKWMTRDDFDRQVALVQAVPGIFNVNLAAFLGYALLKWKGCAVALLGMVLPAFAILLLFAGVFDNVRDDHVVKAFLQGARPAIVVLLVLPLLQIVRKSNIMLSTVWIPIGAAIAIVLLGVSPVYVVAGLTVLGVLYAVIVMSYDH